MIQDDALEGFPECEKSILTYGLSDFAGLSLASLNDRAYICTSLKNAIARHEPRLKNVDVTLELRDGSINRFNFVITAELAVASTEERVSFDAVLQPSSLQYSISRARRVKRMDG